MDKQIKKIGQGFNAEFHVVQKSSPIIRQKPIIVELPQREDDIRMSKQSHLSKKSDRSPTKRSQMSQSSSLQRKEFNHDVKIDGYDKYKDQLETIESRKKNDSE